MPNGNANTLSSKLSQLPGVSNVHIDGNIVRVTADFCNASTTVALLMDTIRTLVRCCPQSPRAAHTAFHQDARYRPFPYVEHSWQWRGHNINYAEV